jgi:glycosyltransferase involved in cell wall biosynthesis
MTPQSRSARDERPRNVLYLHTTSEVGGSDISLVRLVERLDRTRFTPIVALPADGPLVARLETLGCEVLLVERMKKLTSRRGPGYLLTFLMNYPGAVRRLARVVREKRVALVHTNTIHNLYGIGAARLARRPHVWHVREIVWQSGVVRRVERFLTRFSDRIIVTSDAVGRLFETADGRHPENVRKIPNGVDLEVFRPGPADGRVHDALGFPRAAPLVAVVCRLDPWKGVDVFLRAVARVRVSAPAARFAVVGGPIVGQEQHARDLEELAARLGIADIVRFAGWRFGPADMPDVYRALSLLVLPSRQPEPFGLVLLEAMAAARPVAATDHGGPREICVHGETGLLVPPANPDRLGDAIGWVLTHPDRARAMGEAGRVRVETFYDVRNTVRAIEGVYDELLTA